MPRSLRDSPDADTCDTFRERLTPAEAGDLLRRELLSGPNFRRLLELLATTPTAFSVWAHLPKPGVLTPAESAHLFEAMTGPGELSGSAVNIGKKLEESVKLRPTPPGLTYRGVVASIVQQLGGVVTANEVERWAADLRDSPETFGVVIACGRFPNAGQRGPRATVATILGAAAELDRQLSAVLPSHERPLVGQGHDSAPAGRKALERARGVLGLSAPSRQKQTAVTRGTTGVPYCALKQAERDRKRHQRT